MDEIKSTRIGADNEQHNKLLTYSSFKSSFSSEPYLTLVQNRNQRCHLTRLRVSAHRLGVETQRYKRPPVPRTQRFCAYCPPVPVTGGLAVRPVDDECHCLTSCPMQNSNCKLVSQFLQKQFIEGDKIDITMLPSHLWWDCH